LGGDDIVTKVFWSGEGKFSEPPMRLTRGDVRGLIVSSKIDHGPRSGAEKRGSSAEVQNRLLRDFEGYPIFDFCNNVGHKRKSSPVWPTSASPPIPNILRHVRRVLA
jgi:hypothetical protein